MRRLARPLLYTGVVVSVLGLSKYHASSIGHYDFTDSFRFAWAFAYIGLLCVTAYGLGLPDLPRTGLSRIVASVAATGLGALGISSVQLVVGDELLPRFVVFGSVLGLMPWYWLTSSLSWRGRSALEERDRVVIVGDQELAADLANEFGESPERPATVVASLTCAEAAEVGDRRRPLLETVIRERGTVVVLSATAQGDESVVRQAATLHEAGVRVRTRSLFYEEWLGKIPLQDLERASLFFDIGEVHRDRYGRNKRVLDFLVALIGLALLLLLLPVVWLGDAFANRGPLFFVQERVGRQGKTFLIFKFRTMRESDSPTANWTTAHDPRVTPFGRILRISHLDELPQVWNILRGDLSVVGPRPEQPRYVAELSSKLAYYDLRHSVRPGLTGWAQVKYGYAGDESDALEKLQYDFHYLRRQSLTFDLRIVGRTIRSVLGSQGQGR